MNPYRNNPKRKLASREVLAELDLEALAKCVKYTGRKYHKVNPGDFGVGRSTRQPTKSYCDDAEIFALQDALHYLREGIRRGTVCGRKHEWINGWPKHVWAVTKDGVVLEAKHDGAGRDSYHGYPLILENDSIADKVRNLWSRTDG